METQRKGWQKPAVLQKTTDDDNDDDDDDDDKSGSGSGFRNFLTDFFLMNALIER